MYVCSLIVPRVRWNRVYCSPLLPVRTFKSDLKIKWVRPEKVPSIHPTKSGDLKPVTSVDLKNFPTVFQKSEELNNASDLVKRMFTLEFLPSWHTKKEIRMTKVKSVRRHRIDWGSMESRIARMTAGIRILQDYLAKYPRDTGTKVKCKELIEKRTKYLKHLRRWDYKRFEWILEKLDLVYRPQPVVLDTVTRKKSLVKLTDKHCNDLKQQRLDAYKEMLENQKKDFLEEKISKLKWIMKEEEECGITPTVSQSDIDNVIKQLEEIKLKTEKTGA